jgi:hypothetical protein
VSEAWVVNASPLILFARIDRLDLIERLAPALLNPKVPHTAALTGRHMAS